MIMLESFLSFIILLAIILSICIQYRYRMKLLGFLDPIILFQIYFFIQLPLVLFLGVNYELPGFVSLSPKISFDSFIILASLIIAAYCFFVAGSLAAGKAYIRIPVLGYKKFNKTSANTACVLIFLLGYFSFTYLIKINGGYENFMLERESWRAGGMSGQGWLIFPSTTFLAIASLCVVVINANSFRGRRGGFLFALLVCLTVAPATQLGFRGMMLWPALQLLVAYHLRINRLPFLSLALGLLIIISVFTIYGIYRELSSRVTTGIDISIASDFIRGRPDFIFSAFLRSKGADILLVIVSNINNIDEYKFFWPSVIEALTIPVPSGIWADKPIPQSVQFAQVFFGLNGGVSPTIVGDAYWQAGFVGVLTVLFLTGLMIKIYVNSLIRFINHDAILILLLSIFPLMILICESLQGFLNSFVLIYFSCSVLLILLSLLSKFSWSMRKFQN